MNDLGLIFLILGGIAFLLMLGAAFGDWYDARERRRRTKDGPRWH